MKFNNHHVQAHLQCVKESHAYLERIISCVETVPLIKRLEEKEKKEGEIYHDPWSNISRVLQTAYNHEDGPGANRFVSIEDSIFWLESVQTVQRDKILSTHAWIYVDLWFWSMTTLRNPVCNGARNYVACVHRKNRTLILYRWFQQHLGRILFTQSFFPRK